VTHLNAVQIDNLKGACMKKYIWILLFICCSALTACSNDPGRQQIEIAQFEEKQNNREHAIKLYEEVVSKYAGSPNAKIAQERLNALKEDK
jgi:hypothetical protein